MKLYQKIVFVCIIVLASVFRFYRLSEVPPGVNRDEASIGFTAYSLLHTGKDEYGRIFPLSFESFGDWKLPLYIYSTMPFVSFLGMTELAVRLPSALAGTLTVAALFFLVRMLFSGTGPALLSSFVLAVSPWHIHISRVESESNVAALFIVLGTILFLSSIKTKRLSTLILSGIFFAATYYTYHGNHVFTSLFAAGLLFLYRKDVLLVRRWYIALGISMFLISIILAFTLFSANRTKISGIGIFGNPNTIHERIELPRLIHDNASSMLSKLAHNRLVYGLVTVGSNYLRSYSPEFLFIKGGSNHAHNIEGYGNMHLFESIFLILGVFVLLKYIRTRQFTLLLWWLVVAGVAPMITKDAPHSNRMFSVTPALAVIVTLGMRYVAAQMQKKWKYIVPAGITISYAVSLLLYIDAYGVHFPKQEAIHWGHSYKNLSVFLTKPENSNRKVIMSSPEASPYIFLLFYMKYDPETYQKEALRYPLTRDGFTDVSGFGRFSFRPIDWGGDPHAPNTLIVAHADEVPMELIPHIKTTILLPDGSEQFAIIEAPIPLFLKK